MSKKIKIGIINTNREPYPLPHGQINGGLFITGALADALADYSDLAITFFTARDSKSKALIESSGLDSYFKLSKKKILRGAYSSTDKKNILYRERKLFHQALNCLNEGKLDILHVHNNFYLIADLFPLSKNSLVYTCHDVIRNDYQSLNDLENIYFICISKRQSEIAQKNGVNHFSVIYDGIDEKSFDLDPKGGNNFLFVGRFCDEKGSTEAMEVAKKTGKKLKMMGTFDLSPKYIKTTQMIKNNLKEYPDLCQVEQVLNKKQIVKNYQNSKLLIVPIQWEEPFGLVMVEAAACGTPVVALARGAVPEIVKDGKTGFIINASEDDKRGNWIIKKTGIDGLCEGIERIYNMNQKDYQKMRQVCRKHIGFNFTIKKMAENYRLLYKKIMRLK